MPPLFRSLLLAGTLIPLVLVPAPGNAQELGTDCELPEFRELNSTETMRGFRITRIRGPFLLVCPDGVRIRADSAVVYEETGRNHLMGRVRFTSPERELQAREADYFEVNRRLHARGDVFFRDPTRNTEVRGDTLVYLEATDLRPLDDLDVRGRLASALLPREDLAPGEVDPDPYRVSGRRLRFQGDRFFRGHGEVEILREGMRAESDSMVFDRELGNLDLRGRARVEGEDGDFEGERIIMVLPDDILESVTIRERAILRTTDLDLRGDEIRVSLEDEKIQRLVAVSRPGGEGGRPGPRPRAVSEDFILEGDSLDARSPGEVLESVLAVGRARGETRGRTPGARTADALDPAELPGVPDLAAPGEAPRRIPDRDYLEGDEILATFVPLDPAAPSEPVLDALPPDVPGTDQPGQARREYQLETLEATGQARSLYRAPPEDEEEEEEGVEAPLENWTLSYVLADRIAIFMSEGEVERMEAEGEVRILHLEPTARTAQPPATESGGRP
jgi:lipopolysaccharide export system protein LptA